MASPFANHSFLASSGGSVRSRRVSGIRAGSVYGGAGGSGVRISTAPTMLSATRGYSNGFALSDTLDVTADEKATMQNLNDRLASYLEKVHTLEKANAELELKIKQFLESKTSPVSQDFSDHFEQITNLKAKICEASCINGGIFLDIDNAKLAMEDFKIKYENELALRQSVEADIAGLRKLMDSLMLTQSDLEMEAEDMEKEIIILKNTHEENLADLCAQMNGQVHVEIDAPPQEDLTKAMSEIRTHYEGVAARNNKELEAWFKSKSESLNKEVVVKTETLQSTKSEITEVRKKAKGLEIELQAQLSMKDNVESTLHEVQTRYSNMLTGFQDQVLSLEDQLAHLRADLERQKSDYQRLLATKTRLELEIEEYRRLLEGELAPLSQPKKVVILTEEIVDGEVVSSSSSTKH